MTFDRLMPYYAVVVALLMLVVSPLISITCRHPHRVKLSDFYRAPWMALAAISAEALYMLDTILKMANETDEKVRASLGHAVCMTFLWFLISELMLLFFIWAQRSADPRGEGKGWRAWMFALFSNSMALILLETVVLGIKRLTC